MGKGTSGRLLLRLGERKCWVGLTAGPFTPAQLAACPALSIYPLFSEPLDLMLVSLCVCGFRCSGAHICAGSCVCGYMGSFRHSPSFILGGEGQGLSLTRNLLSRLGWPAVSLSLLSKAGISKIAPHPVLFYFVSSPGF